MKAILYNRFQTGGPQIISAAYRGPFLWLIYFSNFHKFNKFISCQHPYFTLAVLSLTYLPAINKLWSAESVLVYLLGREDILTFLPPCIFIRYLMKGYECTLQQCCWVFFVVFILWWGVWKIYLPAHIRENWPLKIVPHHLWMWHKLILMWENLLLPVGSLWSWRLPHW